MLVHAEDDPAIQSLYRFARAWFMNWANTGMASLDTSELAYHELGERTGRLAGLVHKAVQRRLAECRNTPNDISFASSTYGSICYR